MFSTVTKFSFKIRKMVSRKFEGLQNLNFLSNDKLLSSLTAVLHHVAQNGSLTETSKHAAVSENLVNMTISSWEFCRKTCFELIGESF